MKIKYIDVTFRAAKLDIIDLSNKIIDEYAEQGFVLTLRQLYYQIVARDLFPEDRKYTQHKKTKKWFKDLINGTKNCFPNYTWLGTIISNARQAGLVDWDALIDNTRTINTNGHWDGPKDILAAIYEQYAIDKWATQPYRPEVWIEKDALLFEVEPAVGSIQIVTEDQTTPIAWHRKPSLWVIVYTNRLIIERCKKYVFVGGT